MIHRSRVAILIGILATFALITGWLIWHETNVRMHSFISGAPPEDIRELLVPKTIDINLMRPPALRAGDPVRFGDINSLISVIEFGDYECAACKETSNAVKNVLPSFEGKVRFVWREMPVTETHDNAMDAAVLARCAGIQGRYWEAHDALLSASALSASTINTLAKRLDVNQSVLQSCRNDAGIAQAIEEDVTAARADGVNAVPLLFIGTKAYSGSLTEAELREAIRVALES